MAPRPAVAFLAWVLGGSSAGFGCAQGFQVHAMQSPSAHFERYHTIAFDLEAEAPHTFSVSPRSADARQHIAKDALDVLQARGYAVAPLDHADLVLRIESGRREQKIPTSTGSMTLGGAGAGESTPRGGIVPGVNQVPPNYHGELDREERDRVDGAFVIDAFDTATRELVWHGSAQGELTQDEIDDARLERVVRSVLASFPPSTPR